MPDEFFFLTVGVEQCVGENREPLDNPFRVDAHGAADPAFDADDFQASAGKSTAIAAWP